MAEAVAERATWDPSLLESGDIENAEKGDEIPDEHGQKMGQLTRLADIENANWDIPIELVVPRHDQPRQDQRRPEPVSSYTQIMPATVVPFVNTEGEIRFLIVDGERRYNIARERGASHFFVQVIWNPSISELYDMAAIANVDRLNHNPMELAVIFDRMAKNAIARGEAVEQGEAIRAVAEKTRLSESTVRQQLTLLGLPEKLQALIRAGALGTRQGKELAVMRRRGEDLERLTVMLEAVAAKRSDPDSPISGKIFDRLLRALPVSGGAKGVKAARGAVRTDVIAALKRQLSAVGGCLDRVLDEVDLATLPPKDMKSLEAILRDMREAFQRMGKFLHITSLQDLRMRLSALVEAVESFDDPKNLEDLVIRAERLRGQLEHNAHVQNLETFIKVVKRAQKNLEKGKGRGDIRAALLHAASGV